MTRLCAVQECPPQRGRHLDACGQVGCVGCLPRLSAPGLVVCERCRRVVNIALKDLPEFYDELLVKGRGKPSTGRSGFEYVEPINEVNLEVREEIRGVLLEWVKTVLSESWVTGVNDWIPTACGVLGNMQILRMYLHADQFVHDMTTLLNDARNAISPGIPWPKLDCPCGGTIHVDVKGQCGTCDECGQYLSISQWRDIINPESTRGMTLREIKEYLEIHHARRVPLETLRSWRKRAIITRNEEGLFDPIQVTAVVYHREYR